MGDIPAETLPSLRLHVVMPDPATFFRKHNGFLRDLKDRFYYPALDSSQARRHDTWSESLIARHASGIDWEKFSRKGNDVPWNITVLNRHQERWRWQLLSGNEALPWSRELIKRYEDKWYWDSRSISDPDLSSNPALPWTANLIEDYQKKWSWGKLSKNPAIPWTSDLIGRYADRWDWKGLSRNEPVGLGHT